MGTRVPEIVVSTLKSIQEIVLSNKKVGKALAPYYKQLFPLFNIYTHCRQNLGDCMDYSQHNNDDIGELVSTV